MSEKILKFHRGAVEGVDEEKKTLTAIISTVQEDRDGDIVDPASFKETLKHFKKHPVLLANHDYYSLRSQIGEAVDIQVNDKDVRATFKYIAGLKNEDGSPMNQEADWAWELAKRGLASFSIGFLGIEWEPIEKTENGQKYLTGRKFTKIELMEVSQVLIPSNRGALQASAELCEMAFKSFKPDEFPKNITKDAPAPSGTKEPEPPATEHKEADKPHYSEAILGEEGKKPDSEPDKTAIDEAIKSTIKDILGGK